MLWWIIILLNCFFNLQSFFKSSYTLSEEYANSVYDSCKDKIGEALYHTRKDILIVNKSSSPIYIEYELQKIKYDSVVEIKNECYIDVNSCCSYQLFKRLNCEDVALKNITIYADSSKQLILLNEVENLHHKTKYINYVNDLNSVIDDNVFYLSVENQLPIPENELSKVLWVKQCLRLTYNPFYRNKYIRSYTQNIDIMTLNLSENDVNIIQDVYEWR